MLIKFKPDFFNESTYEFEIDIDHLINEIYTQIQNIQYKCLTPKVLLIHPYALYAIKYYRPELIFNNLIFNLQFFPDEEICLKKLVEVRGATNR